MHGIPIKRALAIAAMAVTASVHSADVPQPVTQCEQPLARRLVDAAVAAPSSAQQDGSLYGVQRWNAWTRGEYFFISFPGMLSCAYTVSAIFQGACHPIGKLASVSAVGTALSGWEKVTDPRDVKPGDVVFWRPRKTGIAKLLCRSTHWHVGVAVADGKVVDNDWRTGKPAERSLTRLCVTFAHARRPPS